MRRVWSWASFAVVSAAQNFRRNLAMSLTGGCTIGIILVLVGVVALLTHSVDKVLSQEKQNVSNLTIYLQDSASLASINEFELRLKADHRIRTVSFDDKDAVAQESQLDNPTLLHSSLAVLGYNPLPARIRITTYNLNDLGKINDQVKNNPLVDNNNSALLPTDYHASTINTLQEIITIIQVLGILLAGIFLLISLVIIMNTIRTAVFTRRTEVEIMKLVGATDWFVRWPFIIEGMIGGVGAGVLASLIVWVIYGVAIGWLQSTQIGIPYDRPAETLVLLALVLFGAALGAVGSYLGIRRFLNV